MGSFHGPKLLKHLGSMGLIRRSYRIYACSNFKVLIVVVYPQIESLVTHTHTEHVPIIPLALLCFAAAAALYSPCYTHRGRERLGQLIRKYTSRNDKKK